MDRTIQHFAPGEYRIADLADAVFSLAREGTLIEVFFLTREGKHIEIFNKRKLIEILGNTDIERKNMEATSETSTNTAPPTTTNVTPARNIINLGTATVETGPLPETVMLNRKSNKYKDSIEKAKKLSLGQWVKVPLVGNTKASKAKTALMLACKREHDFVLTVGIVDDYTLFIKNDTPPPAPKAGKKA